MKKLMSEVSHNAMVASLVAYENEAVRVGQRVTFDGEDRRIVYSTAQSTTLWGRRKVNVAYAASAHYFV